MEFRRLEFCNDEAYKSSRDTTPECKSEANCTRRACLFEEVHMFNMDNVQRAYCARNDVCSDRDEVTLSRNANPICQPLLSQASVSLVH